MIDSTLNVFTGKCYFPLAIDKKLHVTMSASSYAQDIELKATTHVLISNVWKPKRSDSNPWLQVSFNERVVITGLGIHGDWSIRSTWRWLEHYEVAYSIDGEDWTIHEQLDDRPGTGSPICDTYIGLIPQFKASHLRVYPDGFLTRRGILDVRIVEIFGCRATGECIMFDYFRVRVRVLCNCLT